MVEEQELSFEELLKQAEAGELKSVETGQKVTGKVIQISKDSAYVDIGMRSEAVLTIPEDSEVEIKEDQDIDVFVLSAKGQVRLSLEPVMGYGDFSKLQDAYEANTAVEGKVVKQNKGGYEINVAGVRCFCPHSQIDLRPVNEPHTLIGQTLEFKVLELNERRKDAVISRRALLKSELEAKLDEVREKLQPGAVLPGLIVDIQPFGAFVDLGGIQGLVHISELAHHQVGRVEDVVQIGDKVEVKLLDMTTDNRGKDRISLSIKALLPDPWDNLAFAEGDAIAGRVARKSNFGLFVTVAEGIDGLVPRRMMRRAGENIEMDDFSEGGEIEVEVVEIDRSDRKITLGLPGWNEEVRSDLKVGEVLQAEVIKVLPAGVLVRGVEDPAKGLIHKRTLRQGSQKQISDTFPQGQRLEVVLESLDELGRMNFVLKGDEDEFDRDAVNQYVDQPGDGDGIGHNPFASFFNKDE